MKLAGTKTLSSQVQKGMNEKTIRTTWNTELTKFKTIRKKYLLYADFE